MRRIYVVLLITAALVCPRFSPGEDVIAGTSLSGVSFSGSDLQLLQAEKSANGLYDESVLRTIDLEFPQEDWWQQLETNYTTKTDIPADLIMDDVTYPGVGVRFRGTTSYMMTKNSKKKSFNISIDFEDPDQRLMGNKTLNLLNCNTDPSFIREVLYFNICRNYTPCAKANFIKLVINGENWGIYANVQQINADFIEEWFQSSDGDRWKADMGDMNGGGNDQNKKISGGDTIVDNTSYPDGGVQLLSFAEWLESPDASDMNSDGRITEEEYGIYLASRQKPDAWQPPDRRQQPGGGGGMFKGGDKALIWLGDDVAVYEEAYDLKSSNTPDPWKNLITTCDVLNNIPLEQLPDTLNTVLAIDPTLWFLAVENVFTDEDSYLTKGADYQIYYEVETGQIHPLEYDGNESFSALHVNRSPFEGEINANRPLISRLLSVPQYRQRYLAHMRTIINQSLDWDILSPQIEAYLALIDDEVRADTKKLYTIKGFDTSYSVFQTFVNNRRNYLLSNTEINRSVPGISSVACTTAQVHKDSGPALNDLYITAETEGSVEIEDVILHYSMGFAGHFDSVTMLDDGAHGDSDAGDGIYGCEIPSLPPGSVIRYYIEARASDAVGTVSFEPAGAEHDIFVYKVSVQVAESSPIVINELLAANRTTLQDPQGDYDDWIELLNISEEEIDLSGMYLSDSEDNLSKWSFPEGTTIASNGYLIVWADEDGGDEPGLHANFKLSLSGESILLVDTDERGNTLLDAVYYNEQTDDASYGRYPDGTGTFEILPAPTPGDANNSPIYVSDNIKPQSFGLLQNFPNPCNSSTVIGFYLPESVEIDLSIYNLMGQKVAALLSGTHQPGTYHVNWNGRDEEGNDLASGVYLYRLHAGVYTKTLRLVLLR